MVTSPTTSNKEMFRNLPMPRRLRHRRAIYGVRSPRQRSGHCLLLAALYLARQGSYCDLDQGFQTLSMDWGESMH